MHNKFPKELSELAKTIVDPSKAIVFNYLDLNKDNRTDGSSCYKSSSFRPISDVYNSRNKIDLDPKTLHRSQKVINPLYAHPKKYVETHEWLNSVHGLIEIQDSDCKSVLWSATGTMIGLNLVLTTSSDLYNDSSCSSLKFYPMINDDRFPFQNGVDVSRVYASTKNETLSCALLVLDYPVGLLTGYFGLYIEEEKEQYLRFKDQEIASSIFERTPRSRGGHIRTEYRLMIRTTTVKEIDKNKGVAYLQQSLHSKADVDGGIIFLKENDKYYVIGMQDQKAKNKEENAENIMNRIKLFTKSDFHQISEWAEDANKSRLSQIQDSESKRSSLLKKNTKKQKICDKEASKGDSWMYILALIIPKQEIKDQGALCLGRNSSWAHLYTLILPSNRIGNKGIAGLAKNQTWIHLHRLDLSSNIIGDNGAVWLGKNVSWVHLHTLDLSSNKIGARGTWCLAKNHSWVHIHSLNLSGNAIDDMGALGLGRNNSWIHLHTLNLSSNNIGAKGSLGIAKNHSWAQLHTLNLSYNIIGDGGALRLGKNHSWTHLHTLDLSGNSIRSKGAVGLARNRSWVRLHTLYLSGNNLEDRAAVGLGKNRSWVHLHNLNLFQNHIRDKGALGLAKNYSWVQLQSLNLSYNHIGVEGVVGLVKNHSWVHLESLKLLKNNIGTKEVSKLRKSHSWVNLQTLIL